jgi:hypothetical protein
VPRRRTLCSRPTRPPAAASASQGPVALVF